MNVLHLFSNYKWTGPAEPAVNLAARLKQLGHRVFFAAGRPMAGSRKFVHEHAAERGLDVIPGLRLAKHIRPISNFSDAAALRRIITEKKIDIIHAHLANDHLVAALAVRGMDAPPKTVRTFYEGSPLPWGLRMAYLLSKHTDRAIFCSRAVRDAAVARYLLDARKTAVLEGAVDVQRFDPDRELPDMRPRFDLGPADYVVGIVARIQPHRRFDILVRAAEKTARAVPDFRLLIIGRGGGRERIIEKPVRELRLEKLVRFAGYLTGDDYVGCLSALDVKAFLVPGSDGSCRAVREAMAMGLPVVAARCGMLPEIVEDGVTGRLVEQTPEELAAALVELRDAAQRRKMSAAARERARRDFDVRRQAQLVGDIYEELLARKH